MSKLKLKQYLLLDESEKSLLNVFGHKELNLNGLDISLSKMLEKLNVQEYSNNDLLNKIKKIEKHVNKEYAIKYITNYLEYNKN